MGMECIELIYVDEVSIDFYFLLKVEGIVL